MTTASRRPLPRSKHTQHAFDERYTGADSTQSWQYLPLAFAVLPPLGSLFHGRSETWTDLLVLLIIAFYLYQIHRMPWSIYFASRRRRVAQLEHSEGLSEGRGEGQRRQIDLQTELRLIELCALAATVLAPAMGAALLYGMRSALSEPDRYINGFSVKLYVLASGVKPWLHLSQLIRNRSLYLVGEVHEGTESRSTMHERIERLESEILHLRQSHATKADLRTLRDGFDVPLAQLAKGLRKAERKDEVLRLTVTERFGMLESRLDGAGSTETPAARALTPFVDHCHDPYAAGTSAALSLANPQRQLALLSPWRIVYSFAWSLRILLGAGHITGSTSNARRT